jgi:hypothetical protein
VAIVAGVGLMGFVPSGESVFGDESETNTEQKIKQKNVCSGFAICSNTPIPQFIFFFDIE